MPEGNESLKPMPERAMEVFGFARANVSVAVPLTGMLDTSKDFEIVGGPATSIVAVAGALVPPK
jgi:hypothetical protein